MATKNKKHTCTFEDGKYHCLICGFGYDYPERNEYCSSCLVVIEAEKQKAREDGYVHGCEDEAKKWTMKESNGVPQIGEIGKTILQKEKRIQELENYIALAISMVKAPDGELRELLSKALKGDD